MRRQSPSSLILASISRARQVELGNSIAPMPLPVRADRIQLQQVILNLIVNAMDAMSNMPKAERKITIRTARIGGLAEVSISDTGPGIPPDRRSRCLNRFSRQRRKAWG